MADGKAKLVAEVVGEYSAGRMFSAANKDMARTAKQGKALNNQMRLMRGGVGQLGHQFQDIAVQLQGGQSPFIVLGQQGSQIVSLMGPHGAMVGAIVAVGAAIAGSMLPNLFGAAEALNELEKEGESLVDRFDELDGVLKAEAIRLNAQEMDNLKEVIADSEEEIRGLAGSVKMVNALSTGQTDKVKEVIDAMQAEVVTITLANEAYEKRSKLTDDTTNATEKLIEKLKKQAFELDASTAAKLKNTQGYKDAEGTNKDTLDNLIKEIDAHEKNAEALKKSTKEREALNREKEAAIKSIDSVEKSLMSEEESIAHSYIKRRDFVRKALELEVIDREAARALIKEINDHEDATQLERFEKNEADLKQALQKETDAKAKAAAEQEAITRKKQMVEDAAIANASKLANQAMGLVDEQSGAAKALFAITQGLAIAQIIVDTQRASLAAGAHEASIGGIAVFLSSKAAVEAMGYASAGIVAGTTLASFEGGGLTGYGARSGGMDGKGGMLAMLHPNEKITDLHKGQGDSKVVNVNFSIQANDTAGFDRLLNSRRGQIVNMINQAVNDRGRPSIA